MRSEKELMEQGLPKWPKMYVTGKPVSIEQAKEIIRRTDSFFTGYASGNDHRFIARVKFVMGMPEGLFDRGAVRNLRQRFGLPVADEDTSGVARHGQVQAWREAWGCVETHYVHNTWVSSCYVYGPYGWCHPDGTIGYVDNIGKWPDTDDVLADWQTLVAAFPFLDLGITLMSGEHCEVDTHPIISFRVRGGKVEVVDPDHENVHEGHEVPKISRTSDDFLIHRTPEGERGIPLGWIRDWAATHGLGKTHADVFDQAKTLIGEEAE